MNELILFDQQLFLFLNHLPHNTLFDSLARFLSGVGMAGIIWLLLGALLFFREEKKDHSFVAKLGGIGFSTYFLVEKILKPLISRPRPDLSDGFSFPSGHATIAWAMAVLLAQKEPRFRWVFYALAAAISFSRIYLGKHYPLDVLAGGVIGWGIGRIVITLKDGGKKRPT